MRLDRSSSPLRSYTLLNFIEHSLTGFAAAAFRSASGEIVFAFRSTELHANGIPKPNDGITDAVIGLAPLPPAQLQDVFDFT